MFEVEIELDGEIIRKEAHDIYDVIGIMTMYPGYKSVKAKSDEKKLIKKKDDNCGAK